jgi:mono/diheme cytochrome c family protein
MTPAVRHGVIGAVILLVVLAVGGWLWSYFGLYNVAADEPHFDFVRNFLGSTMDRSVAARDGDIAVPPLKDPKMIAAGAADYDQMCVGCHLAPGMNDTDLRAGLYPKPPSFARRRRPGNPKEQFWIIKHGIKMTGMPAWGVTHSDDKIWNIVAFFQTLPNMKPEDYKALVQAGQQR